MKIHENHALLDPRSLEIVEAVVAGALAIAHLHLRLHIHEP